MTNTWTTGERTRGRLPAGRASALGVLALLTLGPTPCAAAAGVEPPRELAARPLRVPQQSGVRLSAKGHGRTAARAVESAARHGVPTNVAPTNGLPTDSLPAGRGGGIVRGVINAADFGAVGDGKHDDAEAINAAISSLSKRCGTVTLSSGVFRISTAIRMISCVNLVGSGSAATTIDTAGTAPPPYDNAIVTTATMEGLTASGDKTPLTYRISTPIEGSSTIHLQNIGDAARFVRGSRVVVSGDFYGNSYFPAYSTEVASSNAADGTISLVEPFPVDGAGFVQIQKISIQATDFRIADLSLKSSTLPIYASIYAGLSKHVVIDDVVTDGGLLVCNISVDCTISNSTAKNGGVIELFAAYYSSARNNMLDHSQLELDGGTSLSMAEGNKIIDSHLGKDAASAIRVDIEDQRNQITHNIVSQLPDGNEGIAVVGGARVRGGHLIEGNTIEGVASPGAIGISLEQSPDTVVANNIVISLAKGVTALHSPNLAIAANSFINTAVPYSLDPTSSARERQPLNFWPELAKGNPSPSVANGRFFNVSNPSPTNIANFSDGSNGQEITLVFQDGNTTLIPSAALQLKPLGRYTPLASTVMKFVDHNGQWFEASRAEPSAGALSGLQAGVGSGTQSFKNSPCKDSQTERWIPVTLSSNAGVFYVPACQ